MWRRNSTVSALAIVLSLSAVLFAAAPEATTARQTFDGYLAKVKAGHASDAAMEQWDFKTFMTNAFGDRFTKLATAEQNEAMGILKKIITGAMAQPQVADAMAKAEVKNIVEFKISDDQMVVSFDFVFPNGKSAANQMEYRKVANVWRVVDSGTDGGMLSSQLRGQYAKGGVTASVLEYVRAMDAAGK